MACSHTQERIAESHAYYSDPCHFSNISEITNLLQTALFVTEDAIAA
jgi:hypothetical protein